MVKDLRDLLGGKQRTPRYKIEPPYDAAVALVDSSLSETGSTIGSNPDLTGLEDAQTLSMSISEHSSSSHLEVVDELPPLPIWTATTVEVGQVSPPSIPPSHPALDSVPMSPAQSTGQLTTQQTQQKSIKSSLPPLHVDRKWRVLRTIRLEVSGQIPHDQPNTSHSVPAPSTSSSTWAYHLSQRVNL